MSLSATLGNELFTLLRPLCVIWRLGRGEKTTFSLFFFFLPTNYLVIILIFIGIPSGIEGNETASDQKLQSFHSSVDSPVHCF